MPSRFRGAEPYVPATAPQPDEIAVGAFEGLTVLLVEDDSASREALELILSYYGAAVCSTDSVSAALQSFEHRPPSILVSDIGLPAGDGYALMRAIRARDRGRGARTPAIAVSGYPSQEASQRARQAGFDAFLRKPIDIRALLVLVAALTIGPEH